MGWFINFISSSLGKKFIMSLTGIFLITFLLVHLIGNLQLLVSDDGEAFNLYADFMTSNPLIKFTSYGLYFFILLHAVLGIVLWSQNKKAATGLNRYAVNNTKAVNTNASVAKNMAALGTIILIFLIIHMYQFWFRMKIGDVPDVVYEGAAVADLYALVSVAFVDLKFVIFYVACMFFLALHLRHGFQSSFQTLGLNHKKYTPLIQFLGLAYSILIPLGFAIIPLYFFVVHS
ncbi:MAG: succinate dehydrogenase / fumarate reductase cytochrome b subunit [Paraglaciecola sp.]|jgi:succinate dehydrogenase / fumarate reductase cytochrome b subunit